MPLASIKHFKDTMIVNEKAMTSETVRNNTAAYRVKVAAPEDHDRVMEFLYKHYADMPLFVAFADGRPPYSPPSKGDFTIKAVTDDGKIIGVAINAVKTVFSDDGKSGDKWFEFLEFLDFIDEDAKISSLQEKNIELGILSVDATYRGQGVATRLVEESLRIAKRQGYKVVKMCCTSVYSAAVARRLGWQEVYRLAYKDYGTVSGTGVVVNVLPPHKYIYYYITRL